MGMFIKFECDICGEYECDHSMEQRNSKSNKAFEFYVPPNYSKTEPKVTTGDLICSRIVENEPENLAYVMEIKDGSILVRFMDGRNDGNITTWSGTYLKMGSISFL